jgi:hypothetical protein
MYSDGVRDPYVAIATATTLTLPSTDYVFDLEPAPVGGVRYAPPYGQAVVDGAGSEYFRVDLGGVRYDEVQIGLSYPVKNPNNGLTTLSGKSEPDSTVTVFDGTKPLGTVTADDSGDWHLQTKLSSGTHQFTETATVLEGP